MENLQDFLGFQKKVFEVFSQSNRSEEYLFENLGSLDDICRILRMTVRTGIDRDSISSRMRIFGVNKVKTWTLVKQKAFSVSLDNGMRFMLFIFVISTISKYFISVKIDTFESFLVFSSFLLLYILSFIVDLLIEYRLNDFHSFQMFSVTRDSKKSKVFSEDLVVGDLIHLAAGQMIPADILVVDSEELRINESFYSGKLPESLYDGAFIRSNSEVTSGNLTGLILAVGIDRTSFRLTGSNVFLETQTSHQKNVETLSDRLTFFTFAVGVSVFLIDFRYLYQNAVNIGWVESHLTHVFDFFLFLSVFFVMAVPDILSKLFYLVFTSHLSEYRGCVKKLETFERLGNLKVVCVDTSNLSPSTEVQVKCLSIEVGQTFECHSFSNIPNAFVEKISEAVCILLSVRKNIEFLFDHRLVKVFNDLLEKLTGNRKRTEARVNLRSYFLDEAKKTLVCAVEENKKIQILALGPCKVILNLCSATLNSYNTKTGLKDSEKIKIIQNFVKIKKNSSMKTLSLAFKEISLQEFLSLGGEKGEFSLNSLAFDLNLICSLGMNSVLTQNEVMSIRKTVETSLDVRIITENQVSEGLSLAKKLGILPTGYKKSQTDGLVADGNDLSINHKILLNSPNFMEKNHPINKSMSQIKLLTNCDEQQKYLFLNKLNQLFGEVAVVKRKKGPLDWNFESVFSYKQLASVPSAVDWSRCSQALVAGFIQNHVSMFCTVVALFWILSWTEGRILHEFYKMVPVTAARLIITVFVIPFKRPQKIEKVQKNFLSLSRVLIDLVFNLLGIYFLVTFASFSLFQHEKILEYNLNQGLTESFLGFSLFLLFSAFFHEIFDLKFWKIPVFCIFSYFGLSFLALVGICFSFLQSFETCLGRLGFAFVIVGSSSLLKKLSFN